MHPYRAELELCAPMGDAPAACLCLVFANTYGRGCPKRWRALPRLETGEGALTIEHFARTGSWLTISQLRSSFVIRHSSFGFHPVSCATTIFSDPESGRAA